MKWLVAGEQPGKNMSGFVIPAEAGIQCADGFLVKPGMTGLTPFAAEITTSSLLGPHLPQRRLCRSRELPRRIEDPLRVDPVLPAHLRLGAVLDELVAGDHVADADLTVAAVLAADGWARGRAEELCGREGAGRR